MGASERLIPLKAREVLRKLHKAGFQIIRSRGSAHCLRNPITGRTTFVHLHGSKDIDVGLLHKIVVIQAGLTIEQWNKL